MAEHKIELMLNGQRRSFSVETEETLLHVLREKAGLTGTKKGCDLGECGACTVIMNGYAVNSCCVFAVEADGSTVEPHPTREEIHAAMSGNLCRCTGYTKIEQAIVAASETIDAYANGKEARA